MQSNTQKVQVTLTLCYPSVLLVSQGDEEYAVVPDSKLVVARVAYRNNSSKYLVNDRSSTFTQVTTLLKEKGIDLDNNRFLILQVHHSHPHHHHHNHHPSNLKLLLPSPGRSGADSNDEAQGAGAQ